MAAEPQQAEESALDRPDHDQPGTVVSSSETIPLGYNSKLLRKTAYGCGLFSFGFTGLSGIRNKNPLRAAAGLGTAGVTLISLCIKEQNQPLPNAPLPDQIAGSLFKPGENTLFFNRSWSLVSNLLTVLSGMQSGSNKETLRGVWSMAAGGIEVAGLSDQDRREKRAEARMHGEDVPPEEERAFTQEIFANRWLSLGNGAVRAGLMVGEGMEGAHGKMDRNRLIAGLFYCTAIAALFADNYLVEEQIKETDAYKGKSR